MARLVRLFPIAVFVAAGLILGAGALDPAAVRAERTLRVNDNTGVFDQPSTVLVGSVAHVAYIGSNSLGGPFKVHYAAVNGGADYTNLAPNDNAFRTSAIVTPPTPIEGAYADARHPKIAFRAPNQVVIFFQAKPSSSLDPAYLLYRALLTIDNNAISAQDVRLVGGNITPGDVEDVSFGLVPADNTARIAYANRPAASPDGPFQIHFARVGLDNAEIIGAPIRLSSGDNDTVSGSDGFRPLPSLRLDGLNRAHVAWAANDNVVNAGAIYYALVKEVAGTDNLAIAATQVLGEALSWGHPSVLVSTNSSILVLAADERDPGMAGDVGVVELNPDADNQDGSPADEIGRFFGAFLVRRTVLPHAAMLYRPEAFLDGNGRIHLTGYGSSGTGAVYYAVKTATLFTTPEFVTNPTLFAGGEVPAELPGDYTKTAFGFLNGRIIAFWSGQVDPAGATRNLDATTVPAVLDIAPAEESGCVMVRDPRAGESGRIPGAVLLLLPAAVLGLRRLYRRHRGFIET